MNLFFHNPVSPHRARTPQPLTRLSLCAFLSPIGLHILSRGTYERNSLAIETGLENMILSRMEYNFDSPARPPSNDSSTNQTVSSTHTPATRSQRMLAALKQRLKGKNSAVSDWLSRLGENEEEDENDNASPSTQMQKHERTQQNEDANAREHAVNVMSLDDLNDTSIYTQPQAVIMCGTARPLAKFVREAKGFWEVCASFATCFPCFVCSCQPFVHGYVYCSFHTLLFLKFHLLDCKCADMCISFMFANVFV